MPVLLLLFIVYTTDRPEWVLHCLNDYKNLGLRCTETFELPWKHPSPFIKDWVKLTSEGRGERVPSVGLQSSFQQAESRHMQSDFSHTAKQWG